MSSQEFKVILIIVVISFLAGVIANIKNND